jgi:hypothetical protein
MDMVVYCDSNFAGDKEDSLSTYGYAFMLNGAAVSWTSRKQSKVAHSTFEAEYVAASLTSREELWISKLMADLDLPDHLQFGWTIQLLLLKHKKRRSLQEINTLVFITMLWLNAYVTKTSSLLS